MKKQKTKFLCQQCGYESAKWLGRCPSCSSWNSFTEEKYSSCDKKKLPQRQFTGFSSDVLKLNDISIIDFSKYKTNVKEFDNMIGGGVVAGSLILLGGAPGIGKSTLMLHIANALSQYDTVLYISGEESLSQVKSRAERLKVNKDNILLASETNLQNIIEAINKIEPKFLIIDSIQTTYHPELTSAPGTVAQVRETAAEFLRIAKSKNIIVFLLGHVTKEGDLAGPRVLEHIVDTVLYFENERQHIYRILRAYKNRFGPTSEIGIFEMTSSGLREVETPSLIFLSERALNSAGNIVTVAMEGTRPILLEVQALTSRTVFGMPRRMVSGYDSNRIIILIAVLEKRLGIPLGNQDIFVNIVGGVKVKETFIDLAAACAIMSANYGFVCPKDLIAFGEVGLSGEIRAVSLIGERIAEAEKLGFKKAIVPSGSLKSLSYKGNVKIYGADTLSKAIKILRN
ncbi:MAG: DNA repair protein RadA [Endomicrobium sp.]|jgi:DNA repair protein RadA/Sms|uniref:DNA repair protein RadA n=1 Tax=Candidatus Endomicrobiellum cubanum TaxID=3242325 RepID=UPI00282E7CE8|nr:DNA repair protein RadA [Endomicrobium sp.]